MLIDVDLIMENDGSFENMEGIFIILIKVLFVLSENKMKIG